MKIKNQLFCIFFILSYFTITGGECTTGEQDTDTGNGDPSLEITDFIPFTLPGGNSPFKIRAKGKFNEPGLHNIHLEIFNKNTHCLALRVENLMTLSDLEEKESQLVSEGFSSLCNLGGVYLVSLYTLDGSQNLRSTVYEVEVGNGALTLLNAGLEVDRMSHTNFSTYTSNIISSIHSTFNSTLGDVEVNINNIGTSAIANQDFVWIQSEFPNLYAWENYNGSNQQLQSTIGISHHSNANRETTNPPDYYFCLGNDFVIKATTNSGATRTYLGLANNVNNPENTTYTNRNFAYEFIYNIDQDAAGDPSVVMQSYYNLVANHELIHQIGNVWGANAHTSHTSGDLFTRCVLNEATDLYIHHRQEYFYSSNSYWRICNKHVFNIRNRLQSDAITENDLSNSIEYNQVQGVKQKDRIKLVIELPKNSYKLYEPIEIKLLYINNSNKVDSVFALFDESFTDFMKFNIENQDGKSYNDKYFIEGFLGLNVKPKFILSPGDTLIQFMTLSNYGIESDGRELPFGGNRYIPIGKYKVDAFFSEDYIKQFNPPISSNSLSFEVKELNNEDSNLIKTFNQIKIDLNKPVDIDENYANLKNLISQFKTNTLTEYVSRDLVRNRMLKANKTKSTAIITEAYEKYFLNYPNSYMIIHYAIDYFSKSNNFDLDFTNLRKSKSDQTFLSKYLGNKWVENYLRSVSK